MPPPQFNKRVSGLRWYSLTYQSNEILNNAVHGKIKRIIAGYLVGNFNIVEIHSYIHGNIIFGITTNRPIALFDEIIECIIEPLVDMPPPLLFSLVLVAKNDDAHINYMYVYGSDAMDMHFLDSISDFYP